MLHLTIRRKRRLKASLLLLATLLGHAVPRALADGGAPEVGNGSVVSFDDTAGTPDVAYLRSSDDYLVVYANQLSSGDQNVFGTLIDAATEAETVVSISASLSVEPATPRVASFAGAGCFVATYVRNEEVYIRAFNPTSGLLGSELRISSGSAIENSSSPSITGIAFEPSNAGERGLVVWEVQNLVTGESIVYARAIIVPDDPSPDPVLLPRFEVAKGTHPEANGNYGTVVVAYVDDLVEVHATSFVVTAAGLPASPITSSLLVASHLPHSAPSHLRLCGDASRFLLAWQRGDDDVLYRRLDTSSSSAGLTTAGVVEQVTTSGNVHHQPDVAWSGNRVLLACAEQQESSLGGATISTLPSVRLLEIDPVTSDVGHDYGAFSALGTSPFGTPLIGSNSHPGLCSQREGSAYGGDRFRLVSDGGSIRSREVRPTGGGPVAQLGAPCNEGGYVTLLNGAALNAPFEVVYFAPAAAPTRYLSLHLAVSPVPFMGCDLLAIAGSKLLDSSTGLLTIPALSNPALAGLTLRTQGACIKTDGTLASSQILEFELSE